MTFTVPGKPVSLNNAYPTGRSGRRYPSREYAAWKAAAALIARAAGVRPIEGPVGIDLLVVFPSRRADLDNCIKPILDSLTGIGYADDRQVVEIRARKGLDPKRPRVEVRVEPHLG